MSHAQPSLKSSQSNPSVSNPICANRHRGSGLHKFKVWSKRRPKGTTHMEPRDKTVAHSRICTTRPLVQPCTFDPRRWRLVPWAVSRKRRSYTPTRASRVRIIAPLHQHSNSNTKSRQKRAVAKRHLPCEVICKYMKCRCHVGTHGFPAIDRVKRGKEAFNYQEPVCKVAGKSLAHAGKVRLLTIRRGFCRKHACVWLLANCRVLAAGEACF
jgi:hypothetical protein